MSAFLIPISIGYVFFGHGLVTTIIYCLLYVFAMFGCCQIVGSIQHKYIRGTVPTFATILIWIILLFIGYRVILIYFPNLLRVYYIALGLGFITSITSGRIQ